MKHASRLPLRRVLRCHALALRRHALALGLGAGLLGAAAPTEPCAAADSAPAVVSNPTAVPNPVIAGFHPDPSVCRVGDDYYLVTSSFQFFPGVPIFHSRDLVHWEQIGNVLDRASQLPLAGANCWGGIYAPTLRHHDGRFYMITTNVSARGNFLVTATDPRGPWSEPVWLEQGGIDPSLFWQDGRTYMMSNPDDGIYLCEIDEATGRQLTPSRLIWSGTGGRYPEAPHIYRRGDYYYLLIAEGGTEFGHSATIARSTDIYGPYEACPRNPILTHFRQRTQGHPFQGTGHADLFEAADGSWWLACLAFRPLSAGTHHLGRETFLAPVVWDADGWPVVGDDGTLPAVVSGLSTSATPAASAADGAEAASASSGAPAFGQRPWRDDFDAPALGPEWVYLQNPDSSAYRLRDGRLWLTGRPTTLDDERRSPTFVAHRQEDVRAAWTTRLDLTDKAQPGAEAGMSVYITGAAHYDLFLTPEASADGVPTERARLRLRYRLGALTHVERDLPLPDGAAWLRIEADAERYAFAYSADGLEFHPLGRMDTRYLSSECAGGFTGVVVGLYATAADASAQAATDADAPTAAFDFFLYE